MLIKKTKKTFPFTEKIDFKKNKQANIYVNELGPPSWKILGLDPRLIRRIITLGLPVIIGMLTQSAINTIDLLMVGRLPSEEAISGTSAIFSSMILVWSFGGFLSAISVGTQVISARRFSEGHFKKAGQVLSNSIAVSLIASLIFTIVAQLSSSWLISLTTPSETIRKIANHYTLIRFFGLITMAIMASYKSFYDALGRVRVHMTIAVVMNLTNILFNYFLIFGFTIGSYKFKSLGVYGAAWGSVIAGYVGVVTIIIWSLRLKDRICYNVYCIKNLNIKTALIIAKLSFWSGMATVFLMAGVGLFNYIVGMVDKTNNSGNINSSATSIIMHVMMLVFMTCLAFGTATATLVSQSVGAKKKQLAKQYCWQSVLLATYVISIFAIIAVIFPEKIMSFFLPTDIDNSIIKKETIAIALPSFKIAVLFLSPTSAAALVLTQALYGAGKTRYVMIVEFILHFFFFVPLTYILAIWFNLNLLGCWISAIAYGVALLCATSYKFHKGDWQKTIL